MDLIADGQVFSFNYTAYDQDPDLYVAFLVYDCTTGTPVFLQKIQATYVETGAYAAVFTGSAAKTYLVIGAVYTNNTYSVVDGTRAPSAAVFQVIQPDSTFFGFAYAAYDLQTGLDIEADVINMTTGIPVSEATVVLVDVALGVYFGSFDGDVGETYQIISVVYTDNTFTTPDLTRSPSTESFQAFAVQSNIVVGGSSNVVGQNLRFTLIGDT